MDGLEKFDGERDAVFRLVQTTLVGKPERLYEASKHLSLAGGKMIRPVMCILSCQAAGGKKEDAMTTAAAIEMIHTFTLIHDDIMDNDEMRRGKPAVHAKWGMPTAILAGDLLFSKAFEICAPQTAHILARASSEICEGQEMDMSYEERLDVSEDEYLEMIKKKTAVLLQAATEAGAVAANANAKAVKSFSDYGLNLGMAFQMQDDVLGLTADEKKLGKPVGSDIVEGKKSLIAIRALGMLAPAKKKEFTRILEKKDNSDAEIKAAMELIRESGAIEYCRKKAEYYVRAAKESLKNVPDSPMKKDLLSVADYVVKREL